MRRSTIALAAALALSACTAAPPARIVTNASQSRAEHSEPVFYNGKHYQVRIKYSAALSAYEVTVAGQGRSLGGTPGDRQIAESIASSSVRHFSCPTGRKGVIVPGSSRHSGTQWNTQARCV